MQKQFVGFVAGGDEGAIIVDIDIVDAFVVGAITAVLGMRAALAGTCDIPGVTVAVHIVMITVRGVTAGAPGDSDVLVGGAAVDVGSDVDNLAGCAVGTAADRSVAQSVLRSVSVE